VGLSPTAGWPAVAYAHAQRPHPLAAWLAAPLEAPPLEREPPPPGMAHIEQPAGPSPEEDALLAAEDPLTGLLRMQVCSLNELELKECE